MIYLAPMISMRCVTSRRSFLNLFIKLLFLFFLSLYITTARFRASYNYINICACMTLVAFTSSPIDSAGGGVPCDKRTREEPGVYPNFYCWIDIAIEFSWVFSG